MRRQGYGQFARAVGARFGQAAVDLGWYMGELNAKITAFDNWTFSGQGTPSVGSLGPSYFEGWSVFVSASPAAPKRTRPNGWFTYYAETFPTLSPGASDPAVRAIVESYEKEFVRYYDMALAGGADPPLVRPQLVDPEPAAPQPEPGGLYPPPGQVIPTTPLEKSADFSVGVLFLIAGAALYVAGKTK